MVEKGLQIKEIETNPNKQMKLFNSELKHTFKRQRLNNVTCFPQNMYKQ